MFMIDQLYTRKVPLDSDVDLQAIAASCNGFVGADLEALCREAAMSAIKRHSDANKDTGVFSLTREDWKHARFVVSPSITRGVTVEIPKVTWEDIGGLKDLKVCENLRVHLRLKSHGVLIILHVLNDRKSSNKPLSGLLNILPSLQGWEYHPCVESFFMVLQDARKPPLLKLLHMLPKLLFFL